MNVAEICTRHPECIGAEAALREAAQKMRLLDVGMLPVCENGRLVGSVTDRDITVRAVAHGCDPGATSVRSIMTPEIVYCFEDQAAEEAAHLMEENQIRRLPVLNRDNRLVGILSLGDLAMLTRRERLGGDVLRRVSAPRIRSTMGPPRQEQTPSKFRIAPLSESLPGIL